LQIADTSADEFPAPEDPPLPAHSGGEREDVYFVVVDTNVLLDKLDQVHQLSVKLGAFGLVFVIPLVVVEELDFQKVSAKW
jgi:rRNA-processing protein FCF1